MNNDKLAILTDSASNLTDDLLDLYGIEMISFTAKVGKEDFICWQRGRDYDKAAQGYYDAMRSGAMPQTSLINSHAFIDFFTPFLEAGKDVLYIGMSRGLTGTVGAAQQAAEALRQTFPDRQCVALDSSGASFGEGILVIHAAKMRNEGKSLNEITEEIDSMIPHMNQLFTVDDLVYLHRGGRISSLVKITGSLLGIKPMLKATDQGTIELYGKCRGRRRSLEALAEQFAKTALRPALQIIGIAHADCVEDANFLANRLKELTAVKNVMIRQYDLCSGSHVGPGAIALFFAADKR